MHKVGQLCLNIDLGRFKRINQPKMLFFAQTSPTNDPRDPPVGGAKNRKFQFGDVFHSSHKHLHFPQYSSQWGKLGKMEIRASARTIFQLAATAEKTISHGPKLPTAGPLCRPDVDAVIRDHSGPRWPKIGSFNLVMCSTHLANTSISLNTPHNGGSWGKWRFVWNGCGSPVPRPDHFLFIVSSGSAATAEKTYLPRPETSNCGPTVQARCRCCDT